MWKTILLLILSLVLVPILAFALDPGMDALQEEVLHTLVRIYLAAAVLCFVLSSLTGNHSQVDKLWSLLPLVYVWTVAWRSGWESRILGMAVLVSLWGLRLTFNFARRGGYSWKFWTGEEDYRWALLRAKPELQVRWRWVLFNLLFISLYQMGLILLMTLPALRAMGGRPPGWTDGLLGLLFLALLVLETVADQQQWNYQRTKHALKAGGKPPQPPYDRGFARHGLWARVRHPNYAAEQGIWLVFYFFSVSATGAWFNWSLMGALLLVLLFYGSSQFSESVSAGKYPAYSRYQREVPRFLPGVKRR